ncbi:hypothetical protein NDU88_000892 [Pleurodeles waltl]|uniref:Uncharacterized protein n=1 Tax=Pleurodeles waltl TaxID=8319 RepID=A0AAV7WJA3_PLEWA|nr:hypothetical protein NDU88_000892 [Pleurodeles waltl]
MSLFTKFKYRAKEKKLLERAIALPPKDTPARFMYNKHGMPAIVFLDLWVEYTSQLAERFKWPSTGTFDIENVLKVEEQLFRRKARQGQLEAIEWWRKEAQRRQEKAQGKVEKAQRMSGKNRQEELQEKGKQVVLERMIRESQGNVTGLYPVLPSCENSCPDKSKKNPLLPSTSMPPNDSALIDLLDVPPPYSTNTQPLLPVHNLPPLVSPETVEDLSEAARFLSIAEKDKKDEAGGGEPEGQCPHDPLSTIYPALGDEGKRLVAIWKKIEKIPAVQNNINGMLEFMLRGGDSTPYQDVLKGRNRKQQMYIYTFMLYLFARYFQFKRLRNPAKLEDLMEEVAEEEEGGDNGEGVDSKLNKLLDLMREHRHKFKEGTVTPERKISKQHPVRCATPLGDRFAPLLAFPEPPSSEELYEETEEALDWFFEQEPPLTAEEQELVRTATLWTSQPKIYNSDIMAQLYSSLPLTQRRLASLYMTQHLMTLNRIFRPHQSALEDLLSKCTSLAFFLNIFLDARQEYHDEVARTLLRARHTEYGEKEMYRQYPLREVHPRVNAANELQKDFVYTPLTKLEIMKMKEMVPPHSKDPVGFFKELTDVLTMGIYTLTDLTIILKNLLPPGIYEKLRGQDWLVDNANLNWAALETNDNARAAGADIPDDVKLAPTLILKVLPQLLTTRKENWDAISACKQKPGEDIGDYYTRLEKCFTANSGLKLESDSYAHLFVSKLVENSLPKLRERVQKVESSWQAQSPSQVLRILQYHQNRIRGEEESEKVRVKETKLRALMAQTVMPKSGPQPQIQRKGNNSKGV